MFDFKKREADVLKFWEDHDVFKKSVQARKDQKAKPFVFYEGPPTANAPPAIHHFIGRVFKDVIPRYQTMRGRYVLRKGGWDTHGLPVELQVEKELGFKSKKDIETYGVAAFNRLCRHSVWAHKAEWEHFTRRTGYWVDLDDPYVTYENPYIESLWNIISTFWDKKLLYQAHRVVPFCTRCGTPLSSHEVAQGYKTVTDNSVYLKFRVKPGQKIGSGSKSYRLSPNTYILAWTTTPWTLPGNVALAVGSKIQYVLARTSGSDEHFIIAADLASSVLGAPLAIEREFTGKELIGASYEPLFAVSKLKKPTSYKVYDADFVSTTDGTGVVHTAVMYGEDDYNLGTKLKLVKQHTVDEQGKFFGVSKALDGRYVKDLTTEAMIVESLTERGFLLKSVPYEHEYPFCWRCDTPLLYYAKDSWFIAMSTVNKQLTANNETINWVPGHLKHGRFGQWIAEGKDWAFSRERYWGTPLPIWRSNNGKDTLVARSLKDLETYRARKSNTYWLVRHGESDKNVANIIDDGPGDSHLTDAGKVQAATGAKELKKKLGNKKVDVFLYSPIRRTAQTAQIFSKELRVKKPVADTRLEEIHLGPTMQGCHDSKWHEAIPTYKEKFLHGPPGGESLTDLKKRVWGLLEELEKKHEGKTIVLVSHDYPIWMLMDIANGWTMQESIAQKEKRGVDFAAYARPDTVIVHNLPRDEKGNLDLHRPFIDAIVLKRKGSRTLLHRVPELCDVWFDSGSMPYAQWHVPFEHADIFKEQFPADFISEGIDQTRGWFYTLLAVSTLLGDGAPYRTVLSYGHVLDEKGQKMSKSKGNVVKPDDVFDAVGVDAARWYFYTINAPGDAKNFSLKDVRERLTGFLSTLENCLLFWELYADTPQARNFSHGDVPTHVLDRWMLSRLHGLIGRTTVALEKYDLTGAARGVEQFAVEELSQWWLRRSRKRSDSLGLLRHVLLELSKMIAPFVPFTAEDIHARLHRGTTPATLSVHLYDWPSAQTQCVDASLETQMKQVREFITSGLAHRKEQQIKVRQPLGSVAVPGKPLSSEMEELIRDELNVKAVEYREGAPVSLNTTIGTELRAEGFAREVMRAVQDMRKEAGCRVTDRIYCQWSSSDKDVVAALHTWGPAITKETGLSAFIELADTASLTVKKTFDLAPGKPLSIGIRK